MTSYKYDVVYSTKFKKALKKLIKHGKDINELFDIIDKLLLLLIDTGSHSELFK